MTPAETFWLRVQRRAATLQPDMARALLAAFARLRDALSAHELARLIAVGDVEAVVQQILGEPALQAIFAPFRAKLQLSTRDAVAWFAKDLPGDAKAIGVMFDVLSPHVVEGMRRLDLSTLAGLKDDARDVARSVLQEGLAKGVNPRETARQLRASVGLGANQLEWVANYRAKLEAGESVTGYALRDRRLATRTPAQIDTAVAAYQRRLIALNAETTARTATLDAMKLGQDLAWRDAAEKGLLADGVTLWKQWKGVMDDRERDEHIAMEGETVPMEMPYSNGEMIPGESTYNCRCVSIVFARAE